MVYNEGNLVYTCPERTQKNMEIPDNIMEETDIYFEI